MPGETELHLLPERVFEGSLPDVIHLLITTTLIYEANNFTIQMVFKPALTEHRSCALRQNLLSSSFTLQAWGCKRKRLSSACRFSAYRWLLWANVCCQTFCVVWVFGKPLQTDQTRGIILEETYQKWIQYKDECIKMMRTEPLSTGISFDLMLKSAAKCCHVYLSPGIHSPLWFTITGGLFCNRTFDRYACWPDAPAGSLVNISCPFYLPWFDKGKYSSGNN